MRSWGCSSILPAVRLKTTKEAMEVLTSCARFEFYAELGDLDLAHWKIKACDETLYKIRMSLGVSTVLSALTRKTFADIAATLAEIFNVEFKTSGESFLSKVIP